MKRMTHGELRGLLLLLALMMLVVIYAWVFKKGDSSPDPIPVQESEQSAQQESVNYPVSIDRTDSILIVSKAHRMETTDSLRKAGRELKTLRESKRKGKGGNSRQSSGAKHPPLKSPKDRRL